MAEDKSQLVGAPTLDAGATGFSATKTPKINNDDELTIVTALQSYWNEADNNRKSGLNPRDDKWRQNLNLYWNRYDFSKKAAWQAREVMPEVPQYVDRFAAALKEALIATPDSWYSIIDPADEEGDLAQSIKRMVDVWLTRVGRNQLGQVLPFPATFEEQMKLGALMACSSVVTWKKDVPGGRVAIETVDPRFVWLDHTYRSLYRIRRIEVDRQDLMGLTKMTDTKGAPLYRLDAIASLVNSLQLMDQVYKAEMAGHGVMTTNPRLPVTLDEYIATVIGSNGEVLADRALMVVANNKYLIRGPEKNPFWHGQDWLVFTPLVTTPLSVYGRSYMEDFGSVATTFTELTNLILDAVHTVSMKAWAVVPGALLNPEQAAEGISPNKMFLLDDGMKASDFAQALDLGQLPAESVKVWEMMKNELTEAAQINEIGIGQFAPKGRTSATEVSATQQSSSAGIRSLAQTVETRWLDPTLDLVWKTGLQHVGPNDKLLMAAAGEQMFTALRENRKELIERPITFQARGISQTIARSSMLKSLLGVFQIVGGAPMLAQAFFQKVNPDKFIDKVLELSNVDVSKLGMTQRDQMISSISQPMQQAQANAQGAPEPQGQAGKEMGDLVNKMGIGQ